MYLKVQSKDPTCTSWFKCRILLAFLKDQVHYSIKDCVPEGSKLRVPYGSNVGLWARSSRIGGGGGGG